MLRGSLTAKARVGPTKIFLAVAARIPGVEYYGEGELEKEEEEEEEEEEEKTGNCAGALTRKAKYETH